MDRRCRTDWHRECRIADRFCRIIEIHQIAETQFAAFDISIAAERITANDQRFEIGRENLPGRCADRQQQ
jgi:hypothetical protein